MAFQRPKKQDDEVVEGVAVSDKERKVAKEIAMFYLAMCRVRSRGYSRILPMGMKVENSRYWTNFVKAARECIDLEAEPKHFVEAQFDKVSFRKAIPFPQQLHSESCVMAYMDWVSRNLASNMRAKTAEVGLINDPFEREERKLDKWAERDGVSRKRVLREHKHEFSEAFLEKNGVHP